MPKLESVEILSVGDFINKVIEIDYLKDVIFRGENQLYDTVLTPKIARYPNLYEKNEEYAIKLERQFLNWFKTESPQFLNHQPQSDIEFMIIGQHHGLSTRLLDFTLNPLVALYFAVEDEFEEHDGFVYVVDEMLWDISKHNLLLLNLKEVVKIMENDFHFFVPQHTIPRISHQSGVLALFKTPTSSFNDLKAIFRISGKNKKEIKAMLYKINIHKGSLFQDLDSLCSSLHYRKYNYKL